MGDPAAAWDDSFLCPLTTPVPHGHGQIVFGAAQVWIHGKNAARIFEEARCSGDPRMNFVASGADTVLVRGMAAARKGDKLFHGGIIESGAEDVLIGGPTLASWTVSGVRDILCAHDPGFVRRLQQSGISVQTIGPGAGHTERFWNGSAWEERDAPVYGYGGVDMQISLGQNDYDTANTLYHEHYHVSHGHAYTARNEFETEVAAEQWAIDHGLPEGRPGFRMYDADSGKWVPNREVIKAFVEREVGPLDPPAGAPPGADPGMPFEHNRTNNYLRLRMADNSIQERPPRDGDFYRVEGSERTPMNFDVPVEWFQCP